MGITFWDTANVYQHGTSEELVGRAIKRYSRREDIVLATKVWGKVHDGLHRRTGSVPQGDPRTRTFSRDHPGSDTANTSGLGHPGASPHPAGRRSPLGRVQRRSEVAAAVAKSAAIP